MIVGVGTDLIEIERIRKACVKEAFLTRVYTEEECRQDVLRALRQGMEAGKGYVFATSNCVYTGMALERYEMMLDIWREYGNYDNYKF